MAAEQGHAEAQNNLGRCYLNGVGVQKSYAEARKWFGLAAAQDNQAAAETLKQLDQSNPSAEK
jgi:TPR repeat protein